MATVMVVDDTTVIRDTVAKLLRREGFETVCASNGKEALEAMKSHRPDLVLLDLMMPEMDGIACLDALAHDPQLQNLPVIMMTAVADEGYETKARELGVKDYLVKARFSVGEMLDQVKRHCATAGAAQHN